MNPVGNEKNGPCIHEILERMGHIAQFIQENPIGIFLCRPAEIIGPRRKAGQFVPVVTLETSAFWTAASFIILQCEKQDFLSL